MGDITTARLVSGPRLITHEGTVIANAEQGEVGFSVGDQAYRLKFTTRASIALERRLKLKTGEIIQDLSKFGIEAMRDVLHALLQKYHGADFPDTDKGREKVSDLIDDAGGPIAIMKLIAESIGVGKPEAKDGPNPQPAQDGTGDASTSTGDVAA
jgi:hypothetical protein